MKDIRPIGASYSRISGTNDDRTASLESQEEASIEKLEAEGFRVPAEFRFREQFTGYESIYERPVLIRIRELIKDGEIKGLCCYDTDRLARDSQQLTGLVGNTEKAGCKVLFAKLDHKSGRIGDLILYLRGYASSVEYDQIKDRTMRGRMKVLNAGQLLGNGPTRYGYVWDKECRTRSLHPEQSPIVLAIFTMTLSGITSRRIAEDLTSRGVLPPSASRGQRYKTGDVTRWNTSTIRAILKDPIYMGVSTARKSEVVGRVRGRSKMRDLPATDHKLLSDGRTPAIVTPAMFNEANARLTGRVNKPKFDSDPESHLFRGYVHCAACGFLMCPVAKSAKTNGQNDPSKPLRLAYRCTANYPNRKHRHKCEVCELGARRIDAEAWAAVLRIVSDPAVIEAEMERMRDGRVEAQIGSDLKAAEARRAKAQRRLANLVDAMADADTKAARDAMRDKMRSIEEDLKIADDEVKDLKSRLIPFSRYEENCDHFRSQLEEIRAGLLDAGSMSYSQRRDILEWLGVKVLARKEAPPEITITFPSDQSANVETGSTTTFHVSAPGLTLTFAAIA